ncbi:MAG: DUF2711 family protein [Blastocatellia bacterium]|nr:DUF2711 family protein [Blastocatellia bacterium]
MNKALTTTIGGYRAVFSRHDLADRLLQYAERERVFLPEEGKFDVFSKIAMLRAFRRLGKAFIVIHDEFLEKKVTLDIRGLTDEEFCNNLEYKDYYTCDIDEEILFAIDWDDFFFLIAAAPTTIQSILVDESFEGFFCDDSTKFFGN